MFVFVKLIFGLRIRCEGVILVVVVLFMCFWSLLVILWVIWWYLVCVYMFVEKLC